MDSEGHGSVNQGQSELTQSIQRIPENEAKDFKTALTDSDRPRLATEKTEMNLAQGDPSFQYPQQHLNPYTETVNKEVEVDQYRIPFKLSQQQLNTDNRPENNKTEIDQYSEVSNSSQQTLNENNESNKSEITLDQYGATYTGQQQLNPVIQGENTATECVPLDIPCNALQNQIRRVIPLKQAELGSQNTLQTNIFEQQPNPYILTEKLTTDISNDISQSKTIQQHSYQDGQAANLNTGLGQLSGDMTQILEKGPDVDTQYQYQSNLGNQSTRANILQSQLNSGMQPSSISAGAGQMESNVHGFYTEPQCRRFNNVMQIQNNPVIQGEGTRYFNPIMPQRFPHPSEGGQNAIYPQWQFTNPQFYYPGPGMDYRTQSGNVLLTYPEQHYIFGKIPHESPYPSDSSTRSNKLGKNTDNSIAKKANSIKDGESLQNDTDRRNEKQDENVICENTERSRESERNKEIKVIEVSGIDAKIDKERLEMYFDSKKRSGGGGVKDVTLDTRRGIAYVTFESDEAVKRVLEKQHKLSEKCLHVCLPREMYRDRILIPDVPSDVDSSLLSTFLENRLENDTVDVTFGEEGSALVTFENDIDFQKLSEQLKKKPLRKQYLTFSKIPITNCILVQKKGSDKLDEEIIDLYFENKSKSGGGDIDKIETCCKDGCCLVYFKDHKVVDNVCKRKYHTMNSEKLEVSPYYEYLGQPVEELNRNMQIPDNIELTIEDDKVLYLKNASDWKREVENKAESVNAAIKWPDESHKLLVIECKLSLKNAQRSKLEKWESTVRSVIDQYLQEIESKTFSISAEIWGSIVEKVEQIPSEHIKIREKQKELVVVGRNEEIKDILLKVGNTIENVKQDIEAQKRKITKEIDMSEMELRLLRKTNFARDLQETFPEMQIAIAEHNTNITFEGMPSSVEEGKYKLFQICNSFKSMELNWQDRKLDFFKSKEMKEFIDGKMTETGLHAVSVWNVEADKSLKILALTQHEVVRLSNMLNSAITETPYPYDEESYSLLSSSEWKKAIEDIQKQYLGCVKIENDNANNQIVVMTTKEFAGEVLELIANFFRRYTIHENSFELPRGIMRFVNQYRMKELNGISDEFKNFLLKLDIEGNNIRIRCCQHGLPIVKDKIEKLVDAIQIEKHNFQKPGIKKHLETQGKEKVRTVERKNVCIIEVDEDTSEYGRERNNLVVMCTCDLKNGIQVQVMKGDITQLEVDVIVNAANKDLDHIGGVAGAIVAKGGKMIQDECTDFVQRSGSLQISQVFCSNPGNLKCKKIAHVVGPVWSGGNKNESEDLTNAVINVLNETKHRRYHSIALPAISTGVYKYPLDKATEIIVKATLNFLKENTNTSIRDVYFCDITEPAVTSFKQSLMRIKQEDKHQTPLILRSPITGVKPKVPRKKPSPVPRSCHAQNKITVTPVILKGLIQDQKVDVIVNTTSTDLLLSSGAVSSSLLKAGGDELQKICNSKYRSGIEHEDVAITRGGNLKCDVVFHAALPGWKGDGSNAVRILREYVNKCIQIADLEGYKSIAFPALGTGILKYPIQVVAREMFRCVREFTAARYLREVRFVIHPTNHDVMKAFEQEQQNYSMTDPYKGKSEKCAVTNATFLGHKEDDEKEIVSKDKACLQIGSLMLMVYRDDITNVTVDAIVNSSDKDFTFAGAVASAIEREGGPTLAQEVSSKAGEMDRNGIAVTTSGSDLTKYENIIHISSDGVENPPDWKPKIIQILKVAEKSRFNSVAFPALGTGVRGNPIKSIVMPILQSILEFESNASELKEVHVVIFESHMVEDFIEGLKEEVVQAKSFKPNILIKYWNKFKTAFTPFSRNKEIKKDAIGDISMRFLSSRNPNEDTVTLTFYAESEQALSTAKTELEILCKEDYIEKLYDNKIIRQFNSEQIKTINEVENQCHVNISIDLHFGKIRVYGLPENIIPASGIIEDVIQNASNEKEANLIAAFVQWQFLVITKNGREPEEYPKHINAQIEKSYQDGDEEFSFKDMSGDGFIIDFKNMEEYPRNDPSETVTVLRKDKVETEGNTAYPSHWDEIPDEETVSVQTLDDKGEEYNKIETQFRRTIQNAPLSKILQIQRVQNKFLFGQYMSKKNQIKKNLPRGIECERTLWHGTSADAELGINYYGFNRSFCGKNETVFGQGVYFAVNSSYSAESSCTYATKDQRGNRRIYMCKVLTGDFTKGKRGMRRPPTKTNGGSILYDSVVDNVNRPEIFVIFHDAQAYPEYLITFQ